MVMNLRQLYRDWRHRRFLKKHNLTHRQYELKCDPDYNVRGRRLKRDQYHGYPYIFLLAPQGLRDYGFHGVHPYHEQCEQMMEWCEQNCQGKWRNDWHRIIEDVWEDGEWEENGISGLDVMCFAFKDRKDYVTFLLIWS